MKGVFRSKVLLLFLLIIVVSSCTPEKVYFDKPELNLEGGVVDFAERQQYLMIEHNGLKAILYYRLTGKYFAGHLENTTKYDINQVSIDFIDEDGEIIALCEAVDIAANNVTQVISDNFTGRFNKWSAHLIFHEDLPSTKIKSEPVIARGERMVDGRIVSLDNALLKKYEKFDVIPNKGVEYQGEVFAGRHQSYTLEENGLIVTLQYSSEQGSLQGTICNKSSKTKYKLGVSVVFGNGSKTSTMSFASIKADECKNIGYPGFPWDKFEIYRPDISYYGIDSTYKFEQKTKVRDAY